MKNSKTMLVAGVSGLLALSSHAEEPVKKAVDNSVEKSKILEVSEASVAKGVKEVLTNGSVSFPIQKSEDGLFEVENHRSLSVGEEAVKELRKAGLTTGNAPLEEADVIKIIKETNPIIFVQSQKFPGVDIDVLGADAFIDTKPYGKVNEGDICIYGGGADSTKTVERFEDLDEEFKKMTGNFLSKLYTLVNDESVKELLDK